MPIDARNLSAVAHPLRYVWRGFVDSPKGNFTVFVEAASREDASRKAMQAAEIACDSGGDGLWVENICRFDECVRDGSSWPTRKRIFETGWSGETPVSFVRDPIFLVSPANVRILVDAFASVLDKKIDKWETISRAKAIESLAERHRAIERRFGQVTDETQSDPMESLRRAHVGNVHATESLLEQAFGRPNKTIGDLRTLHWALSFEDGLVVHIYQWFRPGQRKRESTIWDVSSYRISDPDLLEIYGLGRLRCLLSDLELQGLAATTTPEPIVSIPG